MKQTQSGTTNNDMKNKLYLFDNDINKYVRYLELEVQRLTEDKERAINEVRSCLRQEYYGQIANLEKERDYAWKCEERTKEYYIKEYGRDKERLEEIIRDQRKELKRLNETLQAIETDNYFRRFGE